MTQTNKQTNKQNAPHVSVVSRAVDLRVDQMGSALFGNPRPKAQPPPPAPPHPHWTRSRHRWRQSGDPLAPWPSGFCLSGTARVFHGSETS